MPGELTKGDKMGRRGWALAGAACVLLLLVQAGRTEAVYLDSLKSLELVGKLQTRASLRLEESEGFTYPMVEAGDLVQHRNMLLLEFNHDLKYLMNDLPLLTPFRALDLKVKYHIVGRFLYEGVFDYGPEAFRDIQDLDREAIRDFKQSVELWEFYFDLSRGPLFFRVGRQNLSWGETDIFRLLDNINPLDNTFGGISEDVDDRRIPLWMLRGSYNLGTLGPLSSITLESFWVPGAMEATVAPMALTGTPYAPPAPRLPMEQRVIGPEREMENSRWGVRLMSLVGSNLNLSLAHYKSYLDMPTLRQGVKAGLPVLLSPSDAWTEMLFEDVQVTGASMNYWEPHTNIVFRAEAAWFWDEPVFIPELNLKLSDEEIPLPPWLVDVLSELMGIDLESIGFDALPLNPTGGVVPKTDILRYMFGFDKQMWIRFLNKTNTIMLSMQYFGQWIPDYDERMSQLIFDYPKPLEFIPFEETEHTFTFLMNSLYLKGRLQPQLAMAYDVRGAFLLQPSLNFIMEPLRFMLQYSGVQGEMTNFGAFRDRDQISLTVSYLLN